MGLLPTQRGTCRIFSKKMHVRPTQEGREQRSLLYLSADRKKKKRIHLVAAEKKRKSSGAA